MVKQLFLITGVLLLVASCAQVGRLSGGDQDIAAPQPIKTSPVNEAVNFTGNSFSVTFNEYFRLNKPTESIIMVPPHVRPTANIKKKTLNISWEGELQPNTTYALYLNRAVKDISEGNDSVMQFVFSTGSAIDTLSYTCILHDAFSGKPLKDHLIGAYRISDTSLINIAQSDENGIAKMNYLSPGEYSMIAFKDENNDLKPQLNEAIGFKEERISFTETVVDSIPYRIFQPASKPGFRKKGVVSASKVSISFNHLIDSTLRIQDVESKKAIEYRQVAPDSLLLFFHDTVSWRSKKLTFEDEQFVDTLTLLNKTGRSRLQISPQISDILPGEPIILEANQRISEINDSLFILFLTEDTTAISIEKFTVNQDRVYIYPAAKVQGESVLELNPGALFSSFGTNSKRSFNLYLLSENDLTVLEADISSYSVPLVISCFQNGKEVRTVRARGEEKILVRDLLPGEYTFRIVLDENNNGRWDTGDFTSRIQPEKVHFYSEAIRLRPNWESTITFTLDE